MTVQQRALKITAEMGRDEKLALISGIDNMYTKGVPRLGVRKVRMADASMGLRDDEIEATAFPASIGLAATWNPDTASRYGAAVGDEFRAAGIDVVLGPGVNIYRIPQGGRNFEYLGEDPVLASQMVVPYIRGVQSRGVAATVKHFACNNTDWHRCASDSIVDTRTLRELYLRPFEAAVRQADVRSLMTSYNLVNGEYTAESQPLLRDILLGDWEFTGLIMSDWNGAWDAAKSFESGLHLEMPGGKVWTEEAVTALLDSDPEAEERLDAKVSRILSWTFEIEEMAAKAPKAQGKVPEHRDVALQVAREGIVLLKNQDQVLPLDAESGTVAVLGPSADPTPTSGGGAAAVVPIDPVSILDAVRDVAAGVTIVTDESGSADTALVCVGYTGEREREGCDRPFELPSDQVALIRRTAEAYQRTVVVVVAGGGVEMQSWIDEVSAVLHIWYPGEIGAQAAAEIIFGRIEPSGRLPITIDNVFSENPTSRNYIPEGEELYPEPDYVDRVVDTYPVRYEEGLFLGYRHYLQTNEQPLFWFGHGLTYTSFRYTELEVEARESGGAVVRCRLANTGERRGAETVQVYLSSPDSDTPTRLAGFAKKPLASGESAVVEILIQPRELERFDVDAGAFRRVSGEFGVLVGASAGDIRCRGTLTISR